MTPASSRGPRWRLRHPIEGVAAAGTPVTYIGQHPDDPTEHRITVAGQILTVPAYLLTPPARDSWSTTTGQRV